MAKDYIKQLHNYIRSEVPSEKHLLTQKPDNANLGKLRWHCWVSQDILHNPVSSISIENSGQ